MSYRSFCMKLHFFFKNIIHNFLDNIRIFASKSIFRGWGRRDRPTLPVAHEASEGRGRRWKDVEAAHHGPVQHPSVILALQPLQEALHRPQLAVAHPRVMAQACGSTSRSKVRGRREEDELLLLSRADQWQRREGVGVLPVQYTCVYTVLAR